MKHTFYLLIAFSLVVTSCGSEESSNDSESTGGTVITKGAVDNTTPAGTGELVAGYVIANDYSGLANMIITHAEMEKAISGSNAPKEGKEFAIGRIDTEIKVMQTDIKTGLDQIRAAGTNAGIVWEQCTFKEAVPTIDKSRGFEMMRLKCVLLCNGQEHVFTVTDIVGTSTGWKLAGKMIYGDLPQR
jgi:hypothetical protein